MTSLDALKAAHVALRKLVKPKRQAAHVEEGPFAASFRAAMTIWAQTRAEGATFDECAHGLAQTLRLSWPKGTCRCPRCFWRCQACQDTGAVIEARPTALYGHRLVDYVVPCTCEKGRLFQPKPKGQQDFTAAGKTSKPMTKAWER